MIDLSTLVLVEERTADLDEHVDYVCSLSYICYSSPNTSDLTISLTKRVDLTSFRW